MGDAIRVTLQPGEQVIKAGPLSNSYRAALEQLNAEPTGTNE